MIYSQEGYELVMEQLGRLDRALDALRRDVLPKNRERYLLMAEPYEEQIEELHAELRAYQARSGDWPRQAPVPKYLKGQRADPGFLSRMRRLVAA